MNWPGVITAICAASGVMAGIFVFATRSIMQNAIREELEKLDTRFLRCDVAELRFSEIEKHFDYLRDQKHG